ncbi:MAG: hypothetical protein WKF96_22170 [Solirubrobacteraceae bacterium]
METLERLQALRDAAQRVLDDLGRLPGFDDRLRSMEIAPERVSDWDWTAISRALATLRTGGEAGWV